MPIYDYNCTDCGPFRKMRSMAESDAPMACPACGRISRKVITAPFLADMAPHNRIASQRNERSAHAPRVMSRSEFDLHDGHIHSDAVNSQGAAGSLGQGPWIRSRHPNLIGH
jgi:putative FmdB family regulatory protein